MTLINLKAKDDLATYQLLEEKLADIVRTGGKSLVLFHGDDWCPDCSPAVEGFKKIAEGYEGGDVLFYSVYVGNKDQWRREAPDATGSMKRSNVFRIKLPHLQQIPNAALYIGLEERCNYLLANQIALPDSENCEDHAEVFQGMLDLSLKY